MSRARFAGHTGRLPAVCGWRPGVLPDHLCDTDQPSADHLVWPWGPSTSTLETKVKPEMAEPWGRLVPST